MAIYLLYNKVTMDQKRMIAERTRPYQKDIIQMSFYERSIQLVLNPSKKCRKGGQRVLDILVEVLTLEGWGTDLIGRDKSQPPKEYTDIYKFHIPYDPKF